MRINSISTYNSGGLNFKPKSPQNQNVSFGNIVGSADDMIKALNSLPDWKKVFYDIAKDVKILEECGDILVSFNKKAKQATVKLLNDPKGNLEYFLTKRLKLSGKNTFILTNSDDFDRFIRWVEPPSVIETRKLPETLGPAERALSYITGV